MRFALVAGFAGRRLVASLCRKDPGHPVRRIVGFKFTFAALTRKLVNNSVIKLPS
jgi:hypothetical protein